VRDHGASRLNEELVVLDMFQSVGYPLAMPDADEKLTPVDPADLADAIAFALRYSGRKRVHHGDEFMSKIAAERTVRQLEFARFVVMRRLLLAPTRA
jgi:hypothetical protein